MNQPLPPQEIAANKLNGIAIELYAVAVLLADAHEQRMASSILELRDAVKDHAKTIRGSKGEE